jgi:anti-sigma B factor antagonist
MELTVTRNDDHILVQTNGPLDDSSRQLFRDELHPLIASGGTNLILDLTGSPRTNSQGIGSLVALVADANTQGSRVILCHLQSFVAVVVAVTKLDKFFEIVPTVKDAIARTKEPRPSP